MTYKNLFDKAETIQIIEDIFIPEIYIGETNFIIPDQIVNFCIDKYNLLDDSFTILDPMCGVGTIPRIINSRNGRCIGIEIDEDRFNAAINVSDKNRIKFGNFLNINLSEYFFQCIFTSLPFDWFKQNDYKVSSKYARKFNALLANSGFILLDSLPVVKRHGFEWPVALRQCEYLESNGFKLIEITKFKNDKNINQSVIMKFST